MRKIIILLLSTLFLSGCIRNVELKERGIVECFGVDYKDNIYTVTLQMFDNTGSGGGKGTENKVVIGKGKTITEAIYNINNTSGKIVFLGNNKVILIGKNTALEGIEEIVGFFNSDYQTRSKTKMLVCDRDAKDIVSGKIDDKIISAKDIYAIAKASKDIGLIGDSDILLSEYSLNSDVKNGFLLGYIELNEKDKGNEIKITGSALFSQTKMIDILNEIESRGVSWINDKITWTIVTSEEDEKNKFSIIAKNGSSKIKARLSNKNEVSFDVNVNFSGNLSEIIQNNSTGASIEELDFLEEKTANQVKYEIEAAINKCIYENGCDVYFFEQYLRKFHDDFVKANEDNWEDIMKSCKINVNVKSNVERLALEGKS